MDIKINLPTEECTCDAKIFYDKYRKQVDAFIQNELEIAKTAEVVVGRKTLKRVDSAESDYEEESVYAVSEVSDYGETSLLPIILSTKSTKRKTRLPKHKETRKEASESISVSTVTTETYLPKIKVSKKWSDELSSSSSDITHLIYGDKQKEIIPTWQKEKGQLDEGKQLKKKKEEKDVLPSSSSDIMRLIDGSIQKETKLSWQQLVGELLLEEEENVKDELSSSSLETTELLDTGDKQIEFKPQQKEFKPQQKEFKPRQKKPGRLQLKEKKETSEDELSSSSSEIIQSEDEDKQKETESLQKETAEIQLKKKKKSEAELSSSSKKIIQPVDKSKQEESTLVEKDTGETQLKKKKESRDERSSISPEISQTEDGGKQKQTKPRGKKISKMQIKQKKKAEDELSSSSLETMTSVDEGMLIETKLSFKEDIGELQLIKKKKSEDFMSLLKSRSKKEGLDDDFITNLLAQVRETGQEEDLLYYLSYANDEGTLDSLLFSMSEILDTDELEEFIANLINKGKEKKRNSLLLKLIENFKSAKKDYNFMAGLIAKALEDDPDDELFLMLSRSVKEDSLNNLVSNLYQAKKQGQLEDMISVLLTKGKREQTKRILSIANSIAQEQGRDNTFIEDLVSEAKKSGQLDELLSEFKRAHTKGTLFELISSLAPDESPVHRLLSPVTKSEGIKKLKRDLSDSLLECPFDDDFLAKWFAKAKAKGEEKLLLEKLAKVMNTRKCDEFNALARDESVKNIDDLFDIFDELISDDDSDIDVDITVSRKKKAKLLRLKNKPIKKVSKPRKRKATVIVDDDDMKVTDSALLLLQRKYRQMSKLKKQILYKRQYSVYLPDVDYDMVGRHKISPLDYTESEKSDEEEQIHEQKEEKIKSKEYRQSFLQKIYGSRPIRPTPSSTSSASSSTPSKYIARKRLPKQKTPAVVIEKEQPQPAPRKIRKNVVKYVKKKPLLTEKEFTDDSDISSIEELLDKKISTICDISGEERSERGYLVGFRYKDDDETIDWRKKPKKKSSIFSDTYYSDEWMSRARRRAIIYFSARKIDDLFHFLGSHLVSDKPGDPIDYLIRLLGKCIHFRNGIERPPLLFEQYHVESLYYSMDIFNEGFISVDQYRTGMETLFIKEYKNNPRTNKNNMVSMETFIFEALKRQRIHLRNLLRGTSLLFKARENSSTTLGSVWSKIELYHEG